MKTRFALALAAVLACGMAFAHSRQQATVPQDGAELSETPEMIRMTWDDPMRVTMVRLVNAEGAEMPIDRGTGLEPAREFEAEPEPLSPGDYTVEWRGLSSDGHAVQGSFSFRIAD